ncbi:MAG: polymer-forming cytoskeletal protein [Verrucomicrobiota bacterium]|nr:polymer-forming cytoskeletal protein [Verrucomicrobiota bacterium]
MAKPGPAKLSVECPHCGFKQMEYAAVKSTMCRQCGSAFVPSAPKQAEIKLRAPREVPAASPSVREEPSILNKIEGFWKPQRSSIVECFECKAKQEVTSAATSTTCPKCSAHLDLRDYKITTSFSRAIRTHGEVHVTAKGDLSSSNVVCSSALIEGKLRGDLHCAGTVTINYSGKIPGRISGGHVLIERKSEVQFFRRVRTKSIEIRGQMTGEVIAEGVVVIHRNASLDGNVTAKSISVEKGATFSGQLVIGSSGLTQAELLPAQSPAAPKAESAGVLPGLVQPLPVT